MKLSNRLQLFFIWFERQNSAVQAAVIGAIFSLLIAIITGCFQIAAALISKPSPIIVTVTSQVLKTDQPSFEIITVLPVINTPSLTPSTLVMSETPTSAPHVTLSSVTPLASMTSIPAGTTQISPVDGMIMVYVPEGEFVMGSSNGDSDEAPLHKIYLSAYWIDQVEVTNRMYRLCVEARVCKEPADSKNYDDPRYLNYPVVNVNWLDANKYCEWSMRRLPTEAEWEKAARGTDGRTYPWGDAISCKYANYDNCVRKMTEVGSYSRGSSIYSVMDMVGNVWEWVADWYGETYYKNSPYTNPLGPDTGGSRVLKSGSWESNAYTVRPSYRASNQENYSNYKIGFRCSLSSQ